MRTARDSPWRIDSCEPSSTASSSTISGALICCPNNDHDLRRLGRSLGYNDPVKELLSTWRHTAQRVRRLHERLFYSPLLDTVAKIPSNELRLTPDAALDRLKALGYADPTAALRHIAALSQGVTRQAEIQRQLLPAMLGWFAAGAKS